MDIIKVAVFKQNGSIEYVDFGFENDFQMPELEQLIENKGTKLELIEEGFLDEKFYMIFGYKIGITFSSHEFSSCNLFGDAIMLMTNGASEELECLINITESDVVKYFSYECISSGDSISFDGDDEYDFTDGWLINDLDD
jgi:hypothetical protein